MIPSDTPAGMDNCGIAAVAMIAGVSYREAEDIFLRLCGKADMTTVWDRLEVMDSLGIKFSEDVHFRTKPTLTAWYNDIHKQGYRYHVTMRGHVVAVDRGLVFDQVFRSGISPFRSPYKRKQVTSYQKVKT